METKSNKDIQEIIDEMAIWLAKVLYPELKDKHLVVVERRPCEQSSDDKKTP